MDEPIRYIDRTREYYQALGYGTPYRWAHFDDVPFQPLRKPLAQCRVVLATTAAPYRPGQGDQGAQAPYNSAAKPSSTAPRRWPGRCGNSMNEELGRVAREVGLGGRGRLRIAGPHVFEELEHLYRARGEEDKATHYARKRKT